MALNSLNNIVCHYGTTYKDGMTGDPLFLFWIFKGDLTMKAYAMFEEILNVGYLLNGFSILDARFANFVPLLRHLYGRDDW